MPLKPAGPSAVCRIPDTAFLELSGFILVRAEDMLRARPTPQEITHSEEYLRMTLPNRPFFSDCLQK